MDITIIILQSLLALAFLMAGFGKITGSKMHIEGFEHWRLPQWFRVVTGLVELVGAAALIIGYWEPGWTGAGALLLAVTAVGGIITHIRVNDSLKQTLPIVVLGLLSLFVFFFRVSDLTDMLGMN